MMSFRKNIQEAFGFPMGKDAGGVVETVLLISGFAIAALVMVSWVGTAIAGQAANIAACVASANSDDSSCTNNTYKVDDAVNSAIRDEGGFFGITPKENSDGRNDNGGFTLNGSSSIVNNVLNSLDAGGNRTVYVYVENDSAFPMRPDYCNYTYTIYNDWGHVANTRTITATCYGEVELPIMFRSDRESHALIAVTAHKDGHDPLQLPVGGSGEMSSRIENPDFRAEDW